MKQIAQYQDGRLELQQVPNPVPPHGGLLVRVTHSVISAGTERMKVEQARMSLLQKARARPDQVRKVLDTAQTLGWSAALQKVRNRLETPTPLGYSAAGIVHAVDAANTTFRVGDRVAIGGAEWAFHAEYVAVPNLLAARIPEGVDNWQAAYTTIASVALEAVRRLEPTLGSRVLVVGQGLVGLLVTALLRASGTRVMAVDVAPARRPIAEAMGAERVVILGTEDLRVHVSDWTDGFGVDGVVLATAARSNTPTEQAIDALRDRGRIVVVGNTHVELPWKRAYEKEIELRYSRSYGPGRYDASYETGGHDYPIAHVRWTEQRNFEAVLHLMRTGELDVAPLTTRTIAFADSIGVYQELVHDAAKDVGVVLEYSSRPLPDGPDAASQPAAQTLLATPPTRTRGMTATTIGRLDVIGAGNFARTMLLPHLKGRIPFGTVVNQTALSANHVKTKFGFTAAATDADAVVGGDGQSALLIATRHHLHAPLVLAGLAADRHVFVEKPLCLTREQLGRIDAAVEMSAGSVQVGFNRRFAAATDALKNVLTSVPGPKTVSFRVMPGTLEPTHWYANYAESGGRVLGEACHFVDYLCFLIGSTPVRVTAQTIGRPSGRLPFPDSVAALFEFADGSCGQLVYSAGGDSSWPKEVCTVSGQGFVAEIENFRTLTVHHGHRRRVRRFNGKGHAEEMTAWVAFLQGERPHPLPYEQSRQSMLLTFAMLDAIQQGRGIVL